MRSKCSNLAALLPAFAWRSLCLSCGALEELTLPGLMLSASASEAQANIKANIEAPVA